MKTLSEHNKEFSELERLLRVKGAGVACDTCGTEMNECNGYEGSFHGMVVCPKCGERGTKFTAARTDR